MNPVVGEYHAIAYNEMSGKSTNEGATLMVQLTNNFNITQTLSANLTALYVSKQHYGHFTMKPMGNVSIGVRQMLLKNRLSISLTVNDIYLTMKNNFSGRIDNVSTKLMQDNDTRWAHLTLRYNFGSTTVREARHRSTGIEEEIGRAGD